MVVALKYSGAYRRTIRHFGTTATVHLLTGVALGTFVWTFVVLFSGVDIGAAYGVQRLVIVNYMVLTLFFLLASRYTASWFLLREPLGGGEKESLRARRKNAGC